MYNLNASPTLQKCRVSLYDLTVNDKITLSCRELAQKIMKPNGIEIVF